MLPENPALDELTPAQMRGRMAGLERLARRRNTPEARAELERAKSEYAAMRLEDAIKRTVAKWPPIDKATSDRLALLLRGGDAA